MSAYEGQAVVRWTLPDDRVWTHLRHGRLQISALQTDRCRPSRRSQNSVLVARVEVQKYTPDRFPHRRLDRQIEKMIQRLFTKATR